ncbi:unnamed protein product [Pleuronectes platessa]|uniref:Secreted protein n=1 Tax=Pleuronectes platessa TaxID=8262 RepID=A0A9N7UPM5_PLEPL|nr:unnamed protein product [Pleuronectes platessa]
MERRGWFLTLTFLRLPMILVLRDTLLHKQLISDLWPVICPFVPIEAVDSESRSTPTHSDMKHFNAIDKPCVQGSNGKSPCNHLSGQSSRITCLQLPTKRLSHRAPPAAALIPFTPISWSSSEDVASCLSSCRRRGRVRVL